MKHTETLTINRMVDNLKNNKATITIPVDNYLVMFEFCGIYEVDRLSMTILDSENITVYQKIYVQDTLIYQTVADVHYLLLDRGIRIIPTDLMSHILSKSNELNEAPIVSLSNLIKLVEMSFSPVVLNLAKHNFTFGAEDGELKYTVTDPDGKVVEYTCDQDINIQTLSSVLAEATRRPSVDSNYSTMANIVSVHRVLVKLIELGPDFQMDLNYVSLVKHLKGLGGAFTMQYDGDVTTTLEYSDETIHIKTRVPNHYCKTAHLGRDATLTSIIDTIHNQQQNVPVSSILPNHMAIADIIDYLASQD